MAHEAFFLLFVLSCTNHSSPIALFTLTCSCPLPPPLHNSWPKVKHAEQCRQVFSNRPEHSVLRVLTFHPGWTWGGIIWAPWAPPRPEHNTDELSSAESRRNAESSHKGARENKQVGDIIADKETRGHEKVVEVLGCYSGSMCRCCIVPLSVRTSCQ